MRTVKTYVRYAKGLPHKRTEVYENDRLVKVIWQRLPKTLSLSLKEQAASLDTLVHELK